VSAAAMDSSGAGDSISGMRRNDNRLHEKLLFAKSCVKTGRCPGDFRAKDFYHKFDAEAADVRAAEEEAEAAAADQARKQEARAATPPPVAAIVEGMTPKEKSETLRNDVAALTKSTAEHRRSLDIVEKEFNSEVLARGRVNDQLSISKMELRKSQRGLGELRDMYRMQTRELDELRAAIDAAQLAQSALTTASATSVNDISGCASAGAHLSVASTAAATAAATKVATPTPRAAPMTGRCHTSEGYQVSVPPPGGYLAALSKRAASAAAYGGDGGSSSRDQAAVAVEELKSALMVKEPKAPAAEAKLRDHLHSENEKLASVIDAIGELGRHIRSPKLPQQPHSARGPGPPEPSKDDRARAAAAAAGLIAPARQKQAYASVLASRPKDYEIWKWVYFGKTKTAANASVESGSERAVFG